MWPFRKKADKTTPKSEVPPELRPYYDSQSAASTPTQRRIFLVLPLVVLVIAAAAIASSLWFHTRSSTTAHKAAPMTTHHAKHPPVLVKKPTPPSKVSQPAPTVAQGKTTMPKNPSTQSITQPSPQSNTQSSGVPSQSIPNTGPGGDVLLLAAAAGILAMALNYARHLHPWRD